MDARSQDDRIARIREIFRVFDPDERGICEEREVPTIVFALGLNPSLEDLQRIVEDIKGDEPSKFVEYDRLEHVLLGVLQSDLTRRDPVDLILRAFRTLDHQGRGYLTEEEAREFLLNYGEALTEEELDLFLGSAMDPDTREVRYEEYASILALDR